MEQEIKDLHLAVIKIKKKHKEKLKQDLIELRQLSKEQSPSRAKIKLK